MLNSKILSLSILCLFQIVVLTPTTRADDWQVRRSAFDPRVVSRYKALLNRRPNDGYALARLISLYKKHRTIGRLIQEYKTLAEAKPRAFAYQVILGSLYRKTRRTDMAVKHYERAAELKPSSPSVPAALGALYRKLGRTEAAASAFKKALTLSTSTRQKKRHLRSLATLALAARDLQAAKDYFQQLIQLQPKNVFLRIELAQALAQNGNIEQAIAQFRDTLKRTRNSATKADLLKEIGTLLAQQDKDMEAVATYRKAMRLTASGHWLRKELTQRIITIYRQNEDLRGLIAYYEKTWKRRGYFEHQTLGQLYDETGDEDKALRAYRAALSSAPHEVETRSRLILLLERSGQDAEVLAEYRKLVAIAPGNPRYQLELAKRLFRGGRRAEAFKVLKRCGRRFPGDSSVHSALADLYARWGDQKRAMQSAQVLVRIEPREPSHLINLGEQQYLQGKRRKAIETWKRLLRVIPQRHRALAKLADIYGQHEMVREAIDLYRKAIKLKPKSLAYHRDLALLFEHKQRTTDSLRTWKKLILLATRAKRSQSIQEARTHIIDILHRTYQLRHAQRSYQFAFDANPPDIDSGFFLAEGYLKMDQLELAAKTYRRILKAQRDNLEALTALEVVYRKQRKLAAAVSLLKKMALLQPSSARELYQRIAELLLQLYQDQEALVYAKKSVNLGTQDATAYQRLGELLEKKEDYQAAITAYAKAIKIAPSRSQVKFSLARLYTQQGRYARADRLYRQLITTAKTPEEIQKSFRLCLHLSSYLKTLDKLEKALLPLSVMSVHAEHYRRILVKLYRHRTPALIHRVQHGEQAHRDAARRALKRIGVRGLGPLLEVLATTAPPPTDLIQMLGFLGNPNAVMPLLRIALKESPERVATIYGRTSRRRGAYPYVSASIRQKKIETEIRRRVKATVAVGRIADQRALGGLTKLLLSPEEDLRDAAAWALGRLKTPKASAPLVNALGDPRSTVQMMACVGLGQQGDAKLLPVLEEVMLDPQRHERVRAACAWAAGALGDGRILRSLVELLQTGDNTLQHSAAWALARISDKRSLPPLLRALWKNRFEVQQAILWTLVRVALADKPAPLNPPDITLSGTKVDENKFIADLTGEMRRVKPSELVRALPVLLEHHEAIAAGITAALGRHRDISLHVLEQLGAHKTALSLEPLTASADQLPPAAQGQYRRSITDIGQQIAPRVASLLNHPDTSLRRCAIVTYAKIAPPDLDSRLSRLLKARSVVVRIAALRGYGVALRNGSIPRRRVMRVLRDALRTPEWQARLAAIQIAAGLRHSTIVPTLLLGMGDTNGFVRQLAAQALGGIRDPRAHQRLIRGLNDEIPQVRAAACRSLAQQGGSGLRKLLSPLTRDPSPIVRSAALKALR